MISAELHCRRAPVLPVAAALMLGACALPGKRPDAGPSPDASRDTKPRPVALGAPRPTAADEAADWAALNALRELSFDSVPRGSEHLRNVSPPPSPELLGGLRGGTLGHGGVASALTPTYDIEVESYASHERVQYYVDFFRGTARERFTIWLGRANRYEGMIRRVLRAYGVPEDLAYLGLIESGYSNSAVSWAQAVGMWQFIATTARRYGLTVDQWVDERRDPFKATDAAARHLADLNQRFGSWYLAAAAYNGGPGRVSRGLSRLPGPAEPAGDESFFALYDRRYLRLETRDYVPKLIAAAMIAKEPLRYGLDSLPFLQPLIFDEITVPDATGLDVIAGLADTTERAIGELNPQFYRGVTPPERESVVRVPRGTGLEVARRYSELPSSERVTFLTHVVKQGETLSLIGQRYRIPVNLIVAANPGIQPRRLRIGRSVTIPVSRAARAQPTRARRVSAMTPSSGLHRVKWGESLSVLAARYRVRVSDLMRWNGMRRGDILRSGSMLRVRAPGG